jgi:hypothetical protein
LKKEKEGGAKLNNSKLSKQESSTHLSEIKASYAERAKRFQGLEGGPRRT